MFLRKTSRLLLKNFSRCDILKQRYGIERRTDMNTPEKVQTAQGEDIEKKVGKALVYGILSLALVIFTFGIGSLIFAILTLKNVKRISKDCPPEASKKLNISKALGIMGLVASIIMMVLVIIAFVLVGIALIILGIKAVIDICLAIIAAIVSILTPILGAVIARLIGQLITALIEALFEGLSAVLMLIL